MQPGESPSRKQAFVARSLASDLLSMPAMAEAGWDFHFTKNGNQSWATGRDGTKYPITLNPDGHFYLSLLVHDETTVLDPTPSDDVDKQDARALAASTHPQTNGLSAGSARQPVRWHTRAQGLPTKGPTTTVPTVPGTVHEGHDEKSGAADTWTTSTETAPTTEAPAPTSGRTAAANPAAVAPEQADDLHEAHKKAKLEASYEQYRKVHAAWNHSSPAVDEAIKRGITKGATKPPNFHCIWCEMGDPIGARFVRNTKTNSSIPLAPFHHVAWSSTWL